MLRSLPCRASIGLVLVLLLVLNQSVFAWCQCSQSFFVGTECCVVIEVEESDCSDCHDCHEEETPDSPCEDGGCDISVAIDLGSFLFDQEDDLISSSPLAVFEPVRAPSVIFEAHAPLDWRLWARPPPVRKLFSVYRN